jgi:D-lactate dehydrogenase
LTDNPLSKAQIQQLTSLVGKENLLTGKADRTAYGYDNSKLQALPDAVVFPSDTGQVQALVAFCNEHQLALTARGRGTGTTGATVPVRGGLVVSFERMNRILEIDPQNRFARVEPGVLNQTLQDALAEQGFFWPPDPTSAASCTIGGNLAYNSAGPRAVKYGTPRENTLGMTLVTGAGEVFKTGVFTTKGVVGYDLTRLIIGSEGTLGLVTEATLKIQPLAEAKRTMQAGFSSINAAAAAVSAIMAQPVIPCSLEIMDEAAINMVRDYSDLGLGPETRALLMIEVDGSEAALNASVAAIDRASNLAGRLTFVVADTPEAVARLWKTRKALSPALRKIAPQKINEDVVVPVSRIPALVEGLQEISARFGIQIVNFGHAGNGNLHVNLLTSPDNPVHQQNRDDCLQAVFELVLSLQGTLSGEHGVGLVKREFVSLEIDPAAQRLMHAIKQQFDPKGILNPGKTIPALP